MLLSGVAADSHSWSLVYLQLWLEERGHTVRNLGPSVPDGDVLAACRADGPDLLVVSSVNGHGWWDGIRLIRRIRGEPDLAALPAVIGGKLGVNGPLSTDRRGELVRAGFDEVFEEAAPLAAFDAYTAWLAAAAPVLAAAGR